MKNRKGFTLIEILATIVILGILLIIAVPSASNIIKNSKKKTFFVSVSNIVNAIKPENVINENDYCMYNYRDDKENQNGNIESMFVLVHKEDNNLYYSVFATMGDEDDTTIDTYDFSKLDQSDFKSWDESKNGKNSYSSYVLTLSQDANGLEMFSPNPICVVNKVEQEEK